MKRPKSVTVVLPAHGVEGAIAKVVRDLAVAAYALRSREMELDVLLLCGGGDATSAIATATAKDLGLDLTAVPAPAAGPGQAFLDGFRQVAHYGPADLVVTMDATGHHDATQIPHLIDQLVERELHVVIGSRWARGAGTPGLSARRWALGRAANSVFRTLIGVREIRDATTSFRVARVEVVRDFDMTGIAVNSYSVQTAFVAMAIANGYRVGEVPIIYWPAVRPRRPELHNAADVRRFIEHLVYLRDEVRRTRQTRLATPGRTFTDDHFGAADDLERLGTAERFFNWVLDEFHPYLKGSVLEVGAGTGTITRRLVERYPALWVTALEPADNVVGDLEAFAAVTPQVTVLRQTLAAAGALATGSYDAVLYLNVLEHIQDDTDELRRAAEALRPGGALLIFGPALSWLYSELDYKAGHYRRYSIDGLRRLVEAAGFKIIKSSYLDVLGTLPYWLVYRLAGRDSISGTSIWGYDRVIVPISRLLQRVAPDRLIGKNVLLIATKP
jgi:2-polyprenyl-3-methyl-5-hydroxy-6-metoxy-1,4-benzoquinol methylase